VAIRRKRRTVAAIEGDVDAGAEKIAGILALIAIRGMDPDEAAIKLDGIGFSARDISNLLGVGPNYVNVAKHRKRTSPRGAKKKT
jgi:hypothetical protein